MYIKSNTWAGGEGTLTAASTLGGPERRAEGKNWMISLLLICWIMLMSNLGCHPVNASPALLQPPPCLQVPFLLQQSSPRWSPECFQFSTSKTISVSSDKMLILAINLPSAFDIHFLLCSWLYIIQPWPEVKIYQPLNLDFRKRGLWSPWRLLIMPSPPYWAACQERRRRWSSFPPPNWWPRQASTLCNWVDWVINSRSGALGVCTLCKCFAS